jgi:hypothetical protein
LVELYVKHVELVLQGDEATKIDEFKKWINATTNEGFTALHFAAFRGNIVIIHLIPLLTKPGRNFLSILRIMKPMSGSQIIRG